MTNLTCDHCGRTLPEAYFAETIEEYLCETCASGVGHERDDEDFLEELICPECGSYEVYPTMGPNADGMTEYHCDDCGHYFVEHQ